jgi:hypothetical protein
MIRYIIVSVISGILFGTLDGIINGNPLARTLFQIYKPISKTSINIPAGFAIDLLYGFAMAGIFLLLYESLPGSTGILKGISYGIMIWFFRVVMYAFTQWMMIKVPAVTLCYILLTGLTEMVLIGLLYGCTLKI